MATACGISTRTPELIAVGSPINARGGDTLKAHMRSGELYMLTEWSVDTAARKVSGAGVHYDLKRVGTSASKADIPFDSVALFETNRQTWAWPLGLQGVGVLTTFGAFLSVSCLIDPKSCFGSCPTFYVEGDDSARVQAEGFSASVASVLEARDVDALPRAGVHGRSLTIHMRNEAWETHVVRSVSVLAAPKTNDGRVFAASDSLFYATDDPSAPSACAGPEGSCLSRVKRLDGIERSSSADSLDLATRESIELTFPRTTSRPGLVLTARNGLITTFLLYQTMGYVGRNGGVMAASWERGGRAYAESHFGMARLLGDIEVQLRDSSGWRTVGRFGEPGPIASDTRIVPLPVVAAAADSLHVRLRMAKGNWRVDWAALASIDREVTPTRIRAARVEKSGREDPQALASLRGESRRLVSLPGDDYRLHFELPARADSLELFLESEGYYYEWLREQWMSEENPMMAALVLTNPAEALRVLAPKYKSGEGRMEELFWASRFNRGRKP